MQLFHLVSTVQVHYTSVHMNFQMLFNTEMEMRVTGNKKTKIVLNVVLTDHATCGRINLLTSYLQYVQAQRLPLNHPGHLSAALQFESICSSWCAPLDWVCSYSIDGVYIDILHVYVYMHGCLQEHVLSVCVLLPYSIVSSLFHEYFTHLLYISTLNFFSSCIIDITDNVSWVNLM